MEMSEQRSDVSVAELSDKFRLPSLFEKKAAKRVQACCFSPDHRTFALVFQGERQASVWTYSDAQSTQQPHFNNKPTAKLITTIRHSRPVINVEWQSGQLWGDNAKLVLLTRTQDNVVRVWSSLIDDTSFLRTIAVVRIPRDECKTNDLEGSQCAWLPFNNKRNDCDATYDFPRLQRQHRPSQSLGMLSENFHPTDRLTSIETSEKSIQDSTFCSIERFPDVIGQAVCILDAYRWRDAEQHKSTVTASEAECGIQAQMQSTKFDDSTHDAILSEHSISGERTRTVAELKPALQMQRSREVVLTITRYDSASKALFEEARFILQCGESRIVQRPAMAWSTATDASSNTRIPVLAVSLSSHAYIFAPGRSSRWHSSRWEAVARCRMETEDRVPLRPCNLQRVIWLTRNRLLITANNHVWLFDHHLAPLSGNAVRTKRIRLDDEIVRQNSPLPNFHEEILFRCIYWGQLSTALHIVSQMLESIKDTHSNSEQNARLVWLDNSMRLNATPSERRKEIDEIAIDVDRLQDLTNVCSSYAMRDILRLMLDLRRLGGQIDDNAMRYLALQATRRSHSTQLAPSLTQYGRLVNAVHLVGRERMCIEEDVARMSVWALYSETQEPLVQHVQQLHYSGPHRMDWNQARQLGVVMWIRSVDTLRRCLETVARVQYTADDRHDPMSCSILYYALGKDKLVLQMWRQAVWHPEQQKMLRFLQQDFSQQRWRVAAQKNAYALLSQRRFGDCLEDAVNICVRDLHDLMLGIAVCRVWHDASAGQQTLMHLLSSVVLPNGLETCSSWLVAWVAAFLDHRDTAWHALREPKSLENVTRQLLQAILPGPAGDSLRPEQQDAVNGKEVDHESILLLRLQLSHKDKARIEYDSQEWNNLLQAAVRSLRIDGLIGLALSLVRQRFKNSSSISPPSDQSGKGDKHAGTSSTSILTADLSQSQVYAQSSRAATVSSGQDVVFDLDAWDA